MNRHACLIQTTRLTLIAATAHHLQCELESYDKLGEILGANVPSSWPPGLYDRDAMQFFLEKSLQGGDEVLGWYGWYAVHQPFATQLPLLVGSVGYFGPPNAEGIAEIGYSVIPEERGKGLATEMVRAIMDRAWQDERVGVVVAEAHQTNIASLKVLTHCGFVPMGVAREEGYLRFGVQRSA